MDGLAGFPTLAAFTDAQRAARCCAACIARTGLVVVDEQGNETPHPAPELPEDGVLPCLHDAVDGVPARYWRALAGERAGAPSCTLAMAAARALDWRDYAALPHCVLARCEHDATAAVYGPCRTADAAALLERWRAHCTRALAAQRIGAASAVFAVVFWTSASASAHSACALVVDGRVYDGASPHAVPWWAALDGAALVALDGDEDARMAARACCAIRAHNGQNSVYVISLALCAARVLDAPVIARKATPSHLYDALARYSAAERLRIVYSTVATAPAAAVVENVGTKT